MNTDNNDIDWGLAELDLTSDIDREFGLVLDAGIRLGSSKCSLLQVRALAQAKNKSAVDAIVVFDNTGVILNKLPEGINLSGSNHAETCEAIITEIDKSVAILDEHELAFSLNSESIVDMEENAEGEAEAPAGGSFIDKAGMALGNLFMLHWLYGMLPHARKKANAKQQLMMDKAAATALSQKDAAAAAAKSGKPVKLLAEAPKTKGWFASLKSKLFGKSNIFKTTFGYVKGIVTQYPTTTAAILFVILSTILIKWIMVTMLSIESKVRKLEGYIAKVRETSDFSDISYGGPDPRSAGRVIAGYNKISAAITSTVNSNPARFSLQSLASAFSSSGFAFDVKTGELVIKDKAMVVSGKGGAIGLTSETAMTITKGMVGVGYRVISDMKNVVDYTKGAKGNLGDLDKAQQEEIKLKLKIFVKGTKTFYAHIDSQLSKVNKWAGNL